MLHISKRNYHVAHDKLNWFISHSLSEGQLSSEGDMPLSFYNGEYNTDRKYCVVARSEERDEHSMFSDDFSSSDFHDPRDMNYFTHSFA